MKKIIILMSFWAIMCSMVPNVVCAQTSGRPVRVAKNQNEKRFQTLPEEFYATTEQEVVERANVLMSLTKRKYELYKAKEAKDVLHLLYKESGNPDSSFDIELGYDIKMVGANPALEIAGTKEYKFRNILGPYIDIFPIWQKYFAPEADLETTSTQTKKYYSLYLDSEKTIYPLRFIPSTSDGYFPSKRSKDSQWELLKWNDRSRPYE